MNLLTSKTIWGAVIAAALHVAMNPTWPAAGEAVGMVVAAIGMRQAVAKNGTGQ